MNDIEKLFLAAYPLWPKQLLEKFSSLLPFEVAKFNNELLPEIVAQYNSLKNIPIKNHAISAWVNNDISLLSPKNDRYAARNYFQDVFMWVAFQMPNFVYMTEPEFTEQSIMTNARYSDYKKFKFTITADNRIFRNISARVVVNYLRNGKEINISYLSIMSYTSESVQPVLNQAYLKISCDLLPFNGASTVLAMLENGVKVDAEQKLLSEFVTFLNAYNKYSGELAAANSLQTEKNRQTMTDYKNSISEKLNSRKNELNDLRTQISFAAKNETASAKRDMQSLTLSAQSLMLQLQDKLK